MKDKNCLSCGQRKNCQDSSSSWFFFIIGIIATIALRVVTVLMHVSPIYGKIAWYVGVGGFFIFFVYKFKVIKAKALLINQKDLMNKIANQEQLVKDDYIVIKEILCGLSSKKDSFNYFFIFALSALALLTAIYIDFFK